MNKIILIGILLVAFIYLIMRRFSFFSSSNLIASNKVNSSIIEVGIPIRLLKQTIKKTFLTIAAGFALLLITLVLAAKFKIALIMLPISLYLIGQYFLLSNHIGHIKKQRLVYDTKTSDMMVELDDKNVFSFNLNRDLIQVKEYRSVQKNNGVELGYIQLKTQHYTLTIPSLVSHNPQTKPFFDHLKRFDKQIETKLFPII